MQEKIGINDKDGDIIFDKVEEKLRDKEEITKQELIAKLTGLTESQVNIIRKSINN